MPFESSDDAEIEAAKQPIPIGPKRISREERLARAQEEWNGELVDVRDLLGGYLKTAIGIRGSDGVDRFLPLTLDAAAFSGSTLRLVDKLNKTDRDDVEALLSIASQILAPLIVDWPILDRATGAKMEITAEKLAPLSIPFVLGLTMGVIAEVTPDQDEADLDDPKALPAESAKPSSKAARSHPAASSSASSKSRGRAASR